MPQKKEPQTLVITEFGGPLTRRNDGDINSGLAKFNTSWGYDPFTEPGNLRWMEQPVSILSLAGANSVIGVLKPRTIDNTGYVHLFADSGGFSYYRVQVNNTSTNNANFDTASALGQLTTAPNPVRSMDAVFYGNTEKLFYGDDTGLQKINLDGSSPSVIAGANASVPRPMAVFAGKLYFGNGSTIGEIDTTELVTTGAKLSPAFPTGTVVKDLDVTPDGNYLQITSARNNPLGGFQDDPTATPAMSTESYKFLWNGSDVGATAVEKYDGIGLSANQSFGNKNYNMGYDSQGAGIYLGSDKVVSLPKNIAPHPTATFSIGNMLGFMNPEYVDGELRGSLYNYGQYDSEVPAGLFRILRHESTIRTDVKFVNAATNVSNLLYFPSYSSYSNDIAGSGKMYFTTHETSADANADSRSILWKFATVPTGVGSVVSGVYETQTQIFSKKVFPKEVRLYTNPLAADNAFEVDLIGSGGSVISGGSKRFVVGTGATVAGTDMVQYNPSTSPTYALGIRITNASVVGTRNWTLTKAEIDWEPAGK